MSVRLSVDHVSHRWDNLDVLSDISFDLGSDEVLAIVGPSGCGKSTLLSIAGGLVRPTSGLVRAGNFPPNTLNPLTFVFQDFALLPWRSVADNVALGLERRLSRDAIAPIVADVLTRTGLIEFRDALPKHLSGGMRQRVGLARALAVKPAVLLMDEPFSALDSQTRDLLLDDFEDLLTRESLAALYVTHNLDEALRLADRIVVLSRRPATIRAIVPVNIPRDARADPANAAALSLVRDKLWSLIRDGAVEADRERADA